ncbi:MAG TPA: NAD+ synthase [Armatimonadota bacterium]|nr:NAD+ synthase [Armatimonadota bacterium]
MRQLRIALAQINVTVGDLEGNGNRIVAAVREAESVGADIVAVPELALTGYPPEDLLLKPEFIGASRRALEKVAAETPEGMVAVVGVADREDDLYNAAALLHGGRVAAVYRKNFLPTYGVFDEDRYFRAGSERPVFRVAGGVIGVSVCEDIWYPDGPPTAQALDGGAELLVNISSSPYCMGRFETRREMLATRAADTGAFIAYVNLVGGQDELVFDGQSMIFAPDGEVLARGPAFEEAMIVADVDLDAAFQRRLHDPRRRKRAREPESPAMTITEGPREGKPGLGPPLMAEFLVREDEVYRALVVGTRDYVRKNGFEKVVVGVSGGVDSSLVAAIAADALGPENVVGVSMPSRYSSEGSKTDSAALAKSLGIEMKTMPIEEAHAAYESMLAPHAKEAPSVVLENVQARIRGNVLMALSNAHGWLVLTTGNKSEISTGYCTLYGDMAGGFAVLRDVPKTLVYELAKHRNESAGREVIPQSVIDKVPSAELRPEQKDTDSLPPYEVLDPILKAYVEDDRPVAEIVASGNDPEVVARVVEMVDHSEYKRRQAPPGPRITSRAFGRDRRLPITNRFRGGPVG